MRPGVVVRELEVLVLEVEDALDIRIEVHVRQRARLTRKLKLNLIEVIEVNVGVTHRVDKIARLKACHLSHHLKQQSIGSNIEGNSKEGISAPLIELKAETAVCHVKLEERMAWRQCHLVNLCRIPGRYDHAAGVWMCLYKVYDPLDLINGPAMVIWP